MPVDGETSVEEAVLESLQASNQLVVRPMDPGRNACRDPVLDRFDSARYRSRRHGRRDNDGAPEQGDDANET
jgi:hypothetical protein